MGTVPKDIHTEIGTQYSTPIHSHLWRLGDVGTVPKDIRTEIGTQYTTPIHTHFWRFGDVGTVRKDIHTGIGTQYTTPNTLSFLETWGRGDSTQGYTYGDRHNIPPPYTLIFGDLGTWGQYARIYIRR